MADDTTDLTFRDRITITSVSDATGVADVRLVRADKMNALDPDMFGALVEASDLLAKDTSLRAVVLSGEGKSFCAGLDFTSFSAMSEGNQREGNQREGNQREGNQRDADRAERPAITDPVEGRITHHGQQAVYGWTELPVPVIAALHGHALGGGIQLALGADIRIAAPDTKMSVLEIRWGLVPDMTGTQSLVNLVGLDVAKELTFSGRMVGAEEALELGLVTRIADDPRAEALAMAAEIAGKSPHAIRAAKRLFNIAPKLSVADGFAMERAEIGRLIGSPNQAESVKAFFEKRAPNFQDPELDD